MSPALTLPLPLPSLWVTTELIWAAAAWISLPASPPIRKATATWRARQPRATFPLANPIQPNINGGSDIFVSKLGPVIDLAVTETVAPNPVGVGNNVTFTYTITNSGDLTTGIIFTDVVSSGATFVSASSSPGQSSCPANGGSVTCTVGSLNGGAVATVNVVLTPTQAGSLSDGGSVTVFGTKVFVPALPPAVASVNDLAVTVSPQTVTVPAGTPAAYTVTVTPTGNIPETVTLSATGAPTGATTTFPNGASFSNLSSGPQSRQLVVNTTARVTTPASLFPRGNGPFYAALFPVSGLALVGAGIGGKKSLRRRLLDDCPAGHFLRSDSVSGGLQIEQHDHNHHRNPSRHLQPHAHRNFRHRDQDPTNCAGSPVNREPGTVN